MLLYHRTSQNLNILMHTTEVRLGAVFDVISFQLKRTEFGVNLQVKSKFIHLLAM